MLEHQSLHFSKLLASNSNIDTKTRGVTGEGNKSCFDLVALIIVVARKVLAQLALSIHLDSPHRRPKMKHIQNKVQEDVRKIMTEQLQFSSPASVHKRKRNPDYCINQPNFIASSSVFGSEGKGVVVRIVAATTESVYQFLRHQLASLEPLLGVLPYN
uniref:Uncharacterized protein n=1 Tax=Cannabis sativa TaxID=3483 RepID=A0A803QGU3_CANSA